MVANSRHDAIRELKRAGLSVGDIAEKIGCSRQTVWRACRDAEPVPPAPAPAPDLNGHVDLDAARRVGLAVLVDRARGGSVSAAGQLFKQASDQLRADKCVDHIPLVDVVQGLRVQYDLWRSNLKGVFIRRVLLEFDVDPARIESLVDDAIDGITRELNTRFEAESEAEDNHG